MKTRLLLLSVLSTLLMADARLAAEGKGGQDWAEQAARGYEEKARQANEMGNREAAEIYQRMAAIKRAAGEAARRGEAFDWKDYHELQGKLKSVVGKDPCGKDGHGKEWGKQKEKCAEDRRPDQGFIDAARAYKEQGMQAKREGNPEKARLCFRLAELKMQAAEASRQGKDFDWKEYHEIKKRLDGGAECDKPQPQDAPRHRDGPVVD